MTQEQYERAAEIQAELKRLREADEKKDKMRVILDLNGCNINDYFKSIIGEDFFYIHRRIAELEKEFEEL